MLTRQKDLFSPAPTMFVAVFLHATFMLLPFSADARYITFPPASGIERFQQPLTNDNGVDIATGSDFSGLMTFANLHHSLTLIVSRPLIWRHVISPSWAHHSTQSRFLTKLYSSYGGSIVTTALPMCIYEIQRMEQ